MKFEQYAYGRGEGGFGSAASNGAELLLQGVTGEDVRNQARFSKWDDERMVMELQAFPMGDGSESEFILSGSCWVSKNTRPYGYMHSMIVPPGEETSLETALEFLLCSDDFLAPDTIPDAIDGKIYLRTREVSDEKIRKAWESVAPMASEKVLQGLNLHAFLARYWQTCWERLVWLGDRRQTFTPLFVVATSPERFREGDSPEKDTVLIDGVAFFLRHVLPYLPPAVKNMASVSFSSMDTAPDAQRGSACLVCVPTGSAINHAPVYRCFSDSALDNRVDDVVLRIGQEMLENRLPESYLRIQNLENRCFTAERDFDLIYRLVNTEIMLEDIASGQMEEEELQWQMAACLRELTSVSPEALKGEADGYTVQGLLKDDGLTEDEIHQVLFPLELQLAGLMAEKGTKYQADVFRVCTELWKSIPSRCGKLNAEERRQLTDAWEKVLTRTWDELERSPSMPILTAAGDGAISPELRSLLERLLKNGQQFRTQITAENRTTLDQLLLLLLRCRVESHSDLGDALLAKLMDDVDKDSGLLKPAHYLELLKKVLAESKKNGAVVSPEFREKAVGDLASMANRQLQLLREQGDVDGETLYQVYALDRAAEVLCQNGYAGLESLELSLANEISRSGDDYQPACYAKCLKKWRTIGERYKQLPEPPKTLTGAWETVLARSWQPLDWQEDIPVMQVAAMGPTDTAAVQLLERLLKGSQAYSGPITPARSGILDTLFKLVQRCRTDAQSAPDSRLNELGDQLMDYLADHCSREDQLLTPSRYLDQLDEGKPLKDSAREAMLSDLERLLKEHAELVRGQGIQDNRDALEELRFQNDLEARLSKPPMRLPEDVRTRLMADLERMLPVWCTERDRDFEVALYRAMLERAISLPKRSAKLSPETAEVLADVYDKCLTCFYSECGEDRCPMAVMMEQDPQKTIPWEGSVAGAVLESQMIPAGAEKMVDRLIQLRKSEATQKTADLYREILVSGSYNVPEDVFPAYLSGSLSQLRDARLLIVRQNIEEDMLALLQASKDVRNKTQVRDLETYANWYREMRRPGYERLTAVTEALFREKLSDCAEDAKAQVGVVQLFCNAMAEDKGTRENVEGLLFGRLQGKKLSELIRNPEELEPIRVYCSLRRDRRSLASNALSKSIEISGQDGLTMEDLPCVIQFGEYAGLEDISSDLIKVLREVADRPMPEDVRSQLAVYCRDHGPQVQKLVMDCMRQRVADPQREDRTETVTDLMVLLQAAEVKTETKQKYILETLQDLVEHPGHVELNRETVSSLLEAVAELPKDRIKKPIMRLFEAYCSAETFPLMDSVAEKLEIRVEECGQDQAGWRSYFLTRISDGVLEELRNGAADVKTLQSKANEDPQIRQMDDLIKELRFSRSSIAGQVVEKKRQELRAACTDAVKKDNSLQNPEILSEVISSLNSAQDSGMFTTCLVEAAFRHIPELLADDERFSSLVRSEQAIRSVRRCFQQLDVRENAQMQEKQRVVEAACTVMNRMDRLADKGITPGRLISELSGMGEINLPGWAAVREAVCQYGHDKLEAAGAEARLVPHLLYNLESTGDEPKVQWLRFLSDALPLQGKGGWEQANLWKSTENVHGKLALCLQLLGQDGAEQLNKSFVSFLNASAIGMNARRGARFKELKKHSAQIGENGGVILTWLLQNK